MIHLEPTRVVALARVAYPKTEKDVLHGSQFAQLRLGRFIQWRGRQYPYVAIPELHGSRPTANREKPEPGKRAIGVS